MNEKKPLCFVIMPFKKEYRPIFDKIRGAAEDEGFDCKRADEVAIGPITRNIFEHIFYAEAIVADLTDSNPNVFYELGVAHTIGRKTILITQEKEIPFDISGDFIIKYKNTIEGGERLSEELTRLLHHIHKGGVIDNPAQMFLPRTPDQQKIDEFTDKSKEILLALAESRLMEVRMFLEIFGRYDGKWHDEIESDIKTWEKILEIRKK